MALLCLLGDKSETKKHGLMEFKICIIYKGIADKQDLQGNFAR